MECRPADIRALASIWFLGVGPEAGDDARAWRSVLAAVGEEPSLKIVERDDTKRSDHGELDVLD